MARFSTFIIAMVVVSLIVGLFTIFYSGLNSSYSRSDYSEGDLTVYNQLNSLSKNTTSTTESVKNIAAKEGIFDVIGGFFSLGVNAFKTVFTSMDTFYVMSNAGLQDADLGESGNLLKSAIFTIILVVLFIGVVISAYLKWQV